MFTTIRGKFELTLDSFNGKLILIWNRKNVFPKEKRGLRMPQNSEIQNGGQGARV